MTLIRDEPAVLISDGISRWLLSQPQYRAATRNATSKITCRTRLYESRANGLPIGKLRSTLDRILLPRRGRKLQQSLKGNLSSLLEGSVKPS